MPARSLRAGRFSLEKVPSFADPAPAWNLRDWPSVAVVVAVGRDLFVLQPQQLPALRWLHPSQR